MSKLRFCGSPAAKLSLDQSALSPVLGWRKVMKNLEKQEETITNRKTTSESEVERRKPLLDAFESINRKLAISNRARKMLLENVSFPKQMRPKKQLN